MQSIVTKVILPTDNRGMFISARCDAGRRALAWDHAMDATGNHARAAMHLVRELGWANYGNWVVGDFPGANDVRVWSLETGAERFHALDGRY